MVTLDHARQNEEWIVQCRKLDEALVSSLQQDQEDNDGEDQVAQASESVELVGRAIATRAGRLGSLEVAQMQEGSSLPFVENLIQFTRREVDVEAASCSTQMTLLGRLLPGRTQKQKQQEKSTALDVDAFFEEYPECMKVNNIDCDASDNECWSDEEIEQNPKKKKKTKKSPPRDNIPNKNANNGRTSTSTADITNNLEAPPAAAQPQTRSRPSSAQGRPITDSSAASRPPQQRATVPPNNPYQRQLQPNRQNSTSTSVNTNTTTGGAPAASSRQHNNNGIANTNTSQPPPPRSSFNYTPPSTMDEESIRTRSASSWEHHHHTAGSLPNNNNNHNNGNNRRNPYQHRNTNSSNTNNFYGSSSWEDHQSQQNPFQTARELAQTMDSSSGQNHPNNNNNNPYQQQRQSQNNNNYNNNNNGYAQQRINNNNNNINNPYGQQYLPPRPEEEVQQPITGGPRIPESLRKKFQSPKLGANNGNRRPTQGGNNNGVKQPGRSTSSNSNGSNKAVAVASKAVAQKNNSKSSSTPGDDDDDEPLPEELQHLDKELVKKIQNEIIEAGDTITFDDIAGLQDVKQTVQEVVCWPMKRPDLFTGLRRAPNGLLLYGPPGTGKTLIGKAIAHESGATFFSISSSSLTSKWIGEGEKLVRTLFAVAAYREPAVVFIDEIDSLLTQRKSSENEASRRIKTEFLVQLDGTGTSGQGRVLVIGATNRPQELDEAARRRFIKRLYVPLPTESDRRVLLAVMLKTNNHVLQDSEVDKLARDTNGFSGADLKALCTDAAMGPIRQLGPKALEVSVGDVPPISFKHFKKSLKGTKPSVAPGDLVQYEEWDAVYGSKRAGEDDDDDDSDDDDDDNKNATST